MQSANGARAYVLDNNGKTITEGEVSQALTATAYTTIHKRLYNTYIGEWLVFIGAMTALSFLMRYVLQRRNGVSSSTKKKITQEKT